MKKIIFRGFLLFLALVMLAFAALPAFAEEELRYMAYNFYASPDLSKTSKKFDSFMIDFRSDKTPTATYWSLANFGMDLRSKKTAKTYRGISGYGAYAGLQHTSNRVGILSFWEARYTKDDKQVILNAKRIFPKGSSTFTGEGDGTNCIMYYGWQDNQWYRMLLHCWEDEETGTTFAGTWFLDVAAGKWKLFAYFDTQLYDSCFVGAMSQFMENFSGGDVTNNCNVERTCNLKNMYVLDHEKKEWISLPTATLSYGDGGPQTEDQRKFGAHSFGAEEEYFWGSTGGKVANQEEYEKAAVKQATYTIVQPDQPTFGTPEVKTMKFITSNKKLDWSLTDKSTPQLSYKIEAVDASGKTIFTKSASRPEVHSEILPIDNVAVKCVLTITDVFGAETSMEYLTEEYQIATGMIADPSEPTQPVEPTAAETETEPASEPEPVPEPTEEPTQPATEPEKDKSGNTGVIIAVCVGVAAVVGGTVAGVTVARKKKKHR